MQQTQESLFWKLFLLPPHRQAETQAELEMRKAEEGIKKEIVEVSTALANKLLEREINADDHRDLIDSFIEKIGDNKWAI